MGKLRLLAEPFQPFQPASISVEESVSSFIRRRLGEEVLTHLVGPFLAGIYAGDPDQLSIHSVFPKLVQWESTHGSLLKGVLYNRRRVGQPAYALLSLEDGMEALPQALASALPEETLHLNTSVIAITVQPHGGFQLMLSTGETLFTKALVLAVPASASAQLLQPVSAALARVFQSIPYAPLVVCHVGVARDTISHPLDGFGCLMSMTEKTPFLGAIWTSSLFPDRVPANHALLTCFLGGARYPETLSWSDADLQDMTLSTLERLFRIATPLSPRLIRIVRHSQAVPQYTLGHGTRIRQMTNLLGDLPGLFVTGNYLDGVSLDQCVASGEQCAIQTMQWLNGIHTA
jgi:oxygen-dependent protoporphyrinogen oxidase